MKNLFNSIKLQRPKKNVFDLSHDVKTSLNMGTLCPTAVLECIPGDKWNIACESMLRFSPLIAPVMHRMDVYMHYFFVPYRILWPGWEKWIVQDPAAAAFPTVTMNASSGRFTKLASYLGIPDPIGGGSDEIISAFPHAAYQCIYNEYYRDQNLVTAVPYELINGTNNANTALFTLRRRAWEHDYFTAALPFAQKGAAVSLPLAGFNDVPVYQDAPGAGPTTWAVTGGTTPAEIPQINSGIDEGRLYAETSALDAGSSTINDLRRAFKLQEWLERNARGGTRYIENILSHFGVKSSDKRLQRPEYITGSKSPVIISEVVNTAGNSELDLPQGNMAGHGVSVTSGYGGTYTCEEHGLIIGIMSVMPKTAYQQGMPKHYLKTTSPFDYFWPSFANIGEQEVQNREIYAYQASGSGTFGYVPRYAEYKYQPSRVSGDFRTTLDFWHLGRIFNSPPALNQTFVECEPDDRIFAVNTGDDQLWCHVLHKIKAVRAMPKFGNPSF